MIEGNVTVSGDETCSTGAVLLDSLRTLVLRHVALPDDHTADAVVLWIAATHAVPAWEHAPRLAIVSPLKRCGKSRLLDILAETVHDPLMTVNISSAAVFRSISDDPPSLLVDEADTIFGSKKVAEANEEFRGLLNAGHQRNRPTIRCEPPTMAPKKFPTFAMAALAGIGDLPDTIMDRSVIVRMRRRAPNEVVQPFRSRRDTPALHKVRDGLASWLRANLGILECAEPDMPIEDRAADTWEPLVAVADLARGDWPERARQAAKTMTGEAAEDDASNTLAQRLLVDLRTIFGDRDAMYGKDILAALRAIEDAPWSDYFGRELNANDLSQLLRPYGVRPVGVKIHGTTLKGYRRDHLWDVWSRYLSVPCEPSRDAVTPDPPVTLQVDDVHAVTGNGSGPLPVTWPRPLTSTVTGVTAVAAREVSAGAADLGSGTWPPSQTGPCTRCGRLTRRYGAGGGPLCPLCRFGPDAV